jgi:hypothetical protein
MIAPKIRRSYPRLKTWCFVTLLLSFFLLTQCRKDVYKQDADFPDLPAYSEKGLNVGGCFINDTAWLLPKRFLSRTKNLYVRSYPSGDSVILFFTGRFKEDSLEYKQPHTLFVVLKNLRISSDTDLLQLSNRSFVLDGLKNYGGFGFTYYIEKPRSVNGFITFGNVTRQNYIAYGDGSPGNPKRHPYILPGRFEINITAERSYALTHGRFDMSVLQTYELDIIP